MYETTTTRPGLGSQVWHFARRWLEMCVVMCVGGGILNGLLFMAGPALLGYPDLRERSPVLAVLPRTRLGGHHVIIRREGCEYSVR
jgi:hypothetical protein